MSGGGYENDGRPLLSAGVSRGSRLALEDPGPFSQVFASSLSYESAVSGFLLMTDRARKRVKEVW